FGGACALPCSGRQEGEPPLVAAVAAEELIGTGPAKHDAPAVAMDEVGHRDLGHETAAVEGPVDALAEAVRIDHPFRGFGRHDVQLDPVPAGELAGHRELVRVRVAWVSERDRRWPCAGGDRAVQYQQAVEAAGQQDPWLVVAPDIASHRLL